MAPNQQTVIEIVILFQGHCVVYPPHLLNTIPIARGTEQMLLYVNI